MKKNCHAITFISTLFLFVLCLGCGNGGNPDQVATLDTSSEQAFMASLQKIETSLTPEEREQFRNYLGVLLTEFGQGLSEEEKDHKKLNDLYAKYQHDGLAGFFTGEKLEPLTSFHGLTHIEIIEMGRIRGCFTKKE